MALHCEPKGRAIYNPQREAIVQETTKEHIAVTYGKKPMGKKWGCSGAVG